jgi:hypothetical protein
MWNRVLPGSTWSSNLQTMSARSHLSICCDRVTFALSSRLLVLLPRSKFSRIGVPGGPLLPSWWSGCRTFPKRTAYEPFLHMHSRLLLPSRHENRGRPASHQLECTCPLHPGYDLQRGLPGNRRHRPLSRRTLLPYTSSRWHSMSSETLLLW